MDNKDNLETKLEKSMTCEETMGKHTPTGLDEEKENSLLNIPESNKTNSQISNKTEKPRLIRIQDAYFYCDVCNHQSLTKKVLKNT